MIEQVYIYTPYYISQSSDPQDLKCIIFAVDI